LGICLKRDGDLAGEICTGILHPTHTRPEDGYDLDWGHWRDLGWDKGGIDGEGQGEDN
jgi:hypothetical protein